MELQPTLNSADRKEAQPPDRRPTSTGRWQAGLVVSAVIMMCLVAISNRSLWIDEAATAVQAMQPSLGSWWQVLVQEKTAHLQMPLYMFYEWAYEKVFGSGEWTLRMANLPWFVLGAGAFILAFPPGDRRRLLTTCATLLCPFAWYYLDEARPYGMELGASLLIVGSLVRLTGCQRLINPRPPAEHEAAHMALFLFALVVLCGSSLLGMVWAGAALAALPVLLSPSQGIRLVKRYWYLWLPAGGLLVGLAGYYLWTLSIGARASAAATTTVGSALFVGYELLGFTGLGPGRLELRAAGPAALGPYLAWLALYAAALGIILGAALLRGVRERNRRGLFLALCCAVPAVFILAVGWVAHFRVLGRHFAPLMPVLLLIFVSGLAALWSRRTVWARGVVLLFFVLSLVSCLSLRFLPRHQKDNYRAAAMVARTALHNGQPVWWNAAPEGGLDYGVPFATHPDGAGAALLVLNPTPEGLKALPAPQIVIASKPDLYDGQDALARYLREHHYAPIRKFTAFIVWERDRP